MADFALSQITDYDIDVLRDAAGQPTKEPLIPGAAINCAFEFLSEHGLVTRFDGKITGKGRAFLEQLDGK